MKFITRLHVKQDQQQVWEFLSDPLNSNKWDKSIAAVVLPKAGFTGMDCVVETISPAGMRQSFVMTEFEPPHKFAFRLLRSSMFRQASLKFVLEKDINGTLIIHQIEIKLHFWSFFLYPVLLFTQKKALSRDMGYLKAALNRYCLSPS